jgi:hypothetical protein
MTIHLLLQEDGDDGEDAYAYAYAYVHIYMYIHTYIHTYIHRHLLLKEDGDEDEEEAEEGRAEAALSVLRNLSIQPPRIDIVLRSLGYSVPIKGQKEPKILLTDVNGIFRPGTMTALMGSSGAGNVWCVYACRGMHVYIHTNVCLCMYVLMACSNQAS